MKQSHYLLLTTAALALSTASAHAQNESGSSAFGSVVEMPTVVLTQNDGSTSKTGQLLGFENGFYTLLTDDVGTIRVSADAVSCEGAGCPNGDGEVANAETPNVEEAIDTSNARIRFAGSDTIGLKLLPAMMEDYAASLNADINTSTLSEEDAYVRYLAADGTEVGSIFVKSTGSGDAFDGLAAGTADFGMTSRPAKDDEVAQVVRSGDLRGSDNETVIAMDSLTVVTHPDNPVTALTLAQIGAIYQGEITNWSEVGGPDAAIAAVSRDDGSSTRGIFEDAVFSGAELELGASTVYPGGDHPEMAAVVRNNPYAIGYVSAVFSEGLNKIALTSSCGITSTATAFDIKTEQYPLVRRLYLYNRADGISQDAENFLTYAQSSAVDDAIERSEFVSFAVERSSQSISDVDIAFDRTPTAADNRLVNQLTDDMALWDRLSTTVRFPTGTTNLGNKELNDVERLITYLEDLPAGTRVALVGFTDDVGNFDNNLGLSNRRATAMANQITRLAGSRLDNIAFETRAYGELSPAVCNTNANDRAINRRVEVWVRK
ncbi:MAG: phosphate ABC transporter substrate-binding/OmpA family protein [Litoreibacter sp.]